MAKNGRYKEQVYLAFRDIFHGEQVHIRQNKAIRKLIEANKYEAEIRRLVQKHGMTMPCGTVKALLEEQIFASDRLAKKCFPIAFTVPATQGAVAGPAPPIQEDTPMHTAAPIQQALQQDASTSNVAEKHQEDLAGSVSQSASTASDKHSDHTGRILYPISFPFPVQHRILAKLQSILEVACYTCAESKLAHVLRQRVWDCPEAGELNRWTKILLDYADHVFNQSRVTGLEKPLLVFMDSIARIRHAAVHRERVTADEMLQFLNDAELFVKLLEDDAALDIIVDIRRHVQSGAEEMRRNKSMLELRVSNAKEAFSAARADMDREEDEA